MSTAAHFSCVSNLHSGRFPLFPVGIWFSKCCSRGAGVTDRQTDKRLHRPSKLCLSVNKIELLNVIAIYIVDVIFERCNINRYTVGLTTYCRRREHLGTPAEEEAFLSREESRLGKYFS
jgi:hypothetical protein